MNSLQTNLLIIGGGIGGCACALSACKSGLNVMMTEETDWIGGQFTAQATPPDEHGWIEKGGCTATYRQFRNDVRQYYRDHYLLTAEARDNPHLNPGNGWVSPLCAEPKVFLTVLEATLQPYVAQNQLVILKNHIAIAARTEREQVQQVEIQNLQNGEKTIIQASYFIDATELGDLLPLTGTDFVIGSESRAETEEPSAKIEANLENVQAFSMCFAMSYESGADYTIPKPENYEYWRDFVPDLTPVWSGKLLSLTGLSPRTLQPVHYNFQPNQEPNKAFAGLWTYRRILHTDNFVKGAFDSDVTLVNYPQIDYLGGNLIGATPENRKKIIAAAKTQSLSFLYYLQTECGFNGLKLRADIVGTTDGLAKSPYIRESRRIKAVFTVKEQQIAASCRPNQTYAQPFYDSVGVGFYRIDLHPSLGGNNYVDVESLPFQIPLGALIPQKMDNLLPVCKNIGTTHITNGCYRLHPIEWNIGESVGYLLGFCLERNVTPRQVRNDFELLKLYQNQLLINEIQLKWNPNLKLEEGDPHIHAM
jgi:hypothetical protein